MFLIRLPPGSDGVHLDEAGHAIMAEMVKGIIE
jgi:lysophospholipase L1-like esterase